MCEYQGTCDRISSYASVIICINITCIMINVSALGGCSPVLGQLKISDESGISVGDHSFSTYAIFSKKLTLYVSGGKNISFSETFGRVLNE